MTDNDPNRLEMTGVGHVLVTVASILDAKQVF